MNAKIELTGKDYWRSLNQLADTPEYRNQLENEFGEGASEPNDSVTRRGFLSIMGASIALATLAGCRRPVEKIIPYVTAPEQIVPGVPLKYATTMPLGNSAYGLLVESYEGRPTWVEGNNLHPSTLGSVNVWLQASILGLYDPDRSGRLLHNGSVKEWADFVSFWTGLRDSFSQNGGEGLAILSESFSAPTLAQLADDFKKTYPRSIWTTYDPISDENILKGVDLATGRRLQPLYKYNRADVILSLDSDFLATESENITSARGFTDRRRVETGNDSMSRLYVVEGAFTITGTAADHRLQLLPGKFGSFAVALAVELKKLGLNLPLPKTVDLPDFDNKQDKWLKTVAADLATTRGRSLVVAGRGLPVEIHALIVAINDALGNLGAALTLVERNDSYISDSQALSALVGKIRQGTVNTLIMLGGNPVYNTPAELGFTKALRKVENTIHLSQYNDETSQAASWHLPQTHYLESWGDASAVDGALSIIQPQIEPLHGGRSAIELLNLLIRGSETKGYDLVRKNWRRRFGTNDFEKHWRRALHDGILKGSSAKETKARIDRSALTSAIKRIISNRPSNSGLELQFLVSPSLYDGRYANNGWLQELPDSITKLSWDNAALLSPATARQFGLKNEDLIVLSYDGRNIELPIWIVPGIATGLVCVELGYGRQAGGRIANGVGANAYKLRSAKSTYYGMGVAIAATNKTYRLANTQDHGSMEGRPIVREATLSEYRNNPEFAQEAVEHPPLKSLWKDFEYNKGYQWGMTIDLAACIGCNVCTLACQSENNIPIVGKAQVRRGREMHWLRIDRYFNGQIDNPQIVHQPVACQHCETAPCEQVCPVAATVHNKEGLNVMVYNRCIGTRYCSNNCPFKVRRFNFFNYTKEYPETIKMMQNPDVTIRFRGVMEKCTYCVQRINRARIAAKKERRDIIDGEIITACQQACPTKAITFGNIRDKNSKVAARKKMNRNYDLLAELNIKPRTSYLALIRNPNPKLTG